MLFFVFTMNLIGLGLLVLAGLAVAVDELRDRHRRRGLDDAYRALYEREKARVEEATTIIRGLERTLKGVTRKNEHGEVAP